MEKKLVPMTLDEVHKNTLEILRFIVEVCKKLDIQYYGMFGTALGAVRHNGYIPWDDDLDLMMKRPDYEKFLDYFKTHDTSPFYIDNPLNNSHYPFYISRVCDERFVVKFDKYNYESGLFIDIYPFDPMGNDKDMEWWRKTEKTKRRFLKKFISASQYKTVFGHGKTVFQKLVNIPISLIGKMFGNRFFYKELDKYSSKFNWENSKYIGFPTWNMWILFFEKKDFDSVVYLPFENTEIAVPIGYDNILKCSYGDYMTLPPVEKRNPSHDYQAYKYSE